MKRRIALSVFVAAILSVVGVFVLYRSGSLTSGEISFKLESVPQPDGSRQTFYIIALSDANGQRLVTADRLAKEAVRLESGALINNGHGIWSDLSTKGNVFRLEWKGRISHRRGTGVI